MHKVALILLLALPGATYGQSFEANNSPAPSFSSSIPTSTGSAMVNNPPMGQVSYGGREAPVGSLTESFVYVFNDAQYGHNRSLMGWSVVPEVNLVKHFGFEGDFASLYVKSIYPGQSRFLMAAGPRYTFAPRSHVTPFLFAESGEMRLSTQYKIARDWNPVVKGGFGIEYRVTRSWALTLVPGEYLGQYQDDGSWNHSFTTRVGITFNALNGRSPSAY